MSNGLKAFSLYDFAPEEKQVFRSFSKEELLYSKGFVPLIASLEKEKNIRGLQTLGYVAFNQTDFAGISVIDGLHYINVNSVVAANEGDSAERERKMKLWYKIVDLTYENAEFTYTIKNNKVTVDFDTIVVSYQRAFDLLSEHFMDENVARLVDSVNLKRNFVSEDELFDAHFDEIDELFYRAVNKEFTPYLTRIVQDYLTYAESRIREYLQRLAKSENQSFVEEQSKKSYATKEFGPYITIVQRF